MFEDVHTYFYENVLTSFRDYEDRMSISKTGLSIDLRKALVAATSLFHFREHLSEEHKKSRSEFAKICSDYDLLGDIVNSAKHKKLTRDWKYLNSSDSVNELVILTKFNDEQGEYYFSEKIILVKIIDGSERDLFDVLTNVLNMWYEYLFSINILPTLYHKNVIKPVFPLQRDECADKGIDIEAMQGVRFHHTVRLHEYNYETNDINIITPSMGSLKMEIFKPNFEATLLLTHRETKKEISVPIKLTEPDMFNLNKLKNDYDIKRYLIELATKQRILKMNTNLDEYVNETKLDKII